MTQTDTNLRALAASTLAPLLHHQGSLKSQMASALAQCEPRDRALLQAICYGVMRYQPQLAALSKLLLKRPFKARDLDVRALLWVGLYQLEHLRVPPHAAISETVAAAETLGKGWAKGLLNAVQRRYQRERNTLYEQLQSEPSFRYNHPGWLIDKLQHNWPDHWQQILEQNDHNGPMTLRVNVARISRDDYLQQLQEAGIAARPCRFAKQGLTLAEPCDVSVLPGFDDGLVSVQDEAAQLAGELLQLEPGQRLLDACAAPGGKLCHALELQSGLADTVAVELDAGRAERIEQNLERLDLQAALVIGDASSDDWWDGTAFDRVLVDAPCSATGVIRRNPDIKYLRRSEDIKALADLQLAVLSNSWRMLKPGGRLVYATCSIFPQENERLVQRFLKQTDDACHCPIEADWGLPCDTGRQLLPQRDGHDGFYYAVLEKAKKSVTEQAD
ncbi:16S rRNA (cytosine(967)-C(5))-methyltransferase RsmB [Marinobacterium arenosum]|uniref:16S rRNA (cytosine(967)-C(5))-methyltransferase RsmB n=1 Tax=Marinobacterium arenosum TaxID=2862496 RepID=UPI001C96828D|nr:16S rRNA (cytosine(967)-C(5))-methyltransferase RsmB [Marinobacterium arenosum]MBY4677728.1 16S rRNA (cytosine(967)-C(5))-methyltransferase RsmB [Marinobacterium arenosum]